MQSYTAVIRLFLVPKLAYLDPLILMKGTVFQKVTKLDGICKWRGGKGHWWANYRIIQQPESRKKL